jgi:hypothetical protein
MVSYAEMMALHACDEQETMQVVLCARVEQVMMVVLSAHVECEMALVPVAESMKMKGTKSGLGLVNAESEAPCLRQHPANYRIHRQWVHYASYDLY